MTWCTGPRNRLDILEKTKPKNKVSVTKQMCSKTRQALVGWHNLSMMPRLLGSHSKILSQRGRKMAGPVCSLKAFLVLLSRGSTGMIKMRNRAGKMAQQAKELAARPSDPSLILGSHMKEGENHLTSVHVPRHSHMHVCTRNNKNKTCRK